MLLLLSASHHLYARIGVLLYCTQTFHKFFAATARVLLLFLSFFYFLPYIYIWHWHLADAFIQSDLQRVHLLKERQQYIAVVPEDTYYHTY